MSALQHCDSVLPNYLMWKVTKSESMLKYLLQNIYTAEKYETSTCI